MLTFAYYVLKVIICSGILYGYYLLALRNKIFHGWNRFYLLSAIILSLVVPLIKIDIFQNTGGPTQVVQLLQVVSTGDEFVYEYTKSRGFHIDATNLSVFIYTVVSIFLLVILIQTLVKIAKLKKNNNQTIVEGVNFINTKAEGTPFSFFNDIFWNDKIDINTTTGKQIFKHEVAHVQEKHSYDKIFINIVLIFFWCNPFFWFIRKELNIIHEFIADKKALEDSDTAAFAVMILQATYPQQRFIITNNFFYSPLKRRLAMLTKNKNPRINYVSWLLALPLAALIFFAFTFKVKKINHVFPKKSEAPDLTKESGIISQNLGIIKSPELIIDTIPDMRYNNKKVTNLKVIPSDVKIKVTYDDGTNEYITMVEAKKRGFVLPPPPPPTMPLTSSVDLTYVLNGKIISKAEFNSVSPDNIQSINVIKGNNAFIKYGNDGKNGVIEVITKNEKARSYDKRESVTADSTNFNGIENNVLIKGNKTDTIYWNNDKVFTKVEVEPSFPGGDMAWARYIKKTIEGNINELSSENKSGTCRVRFIVDIDGSVRDVKVLSMEGTKLAEVTMNAIKKGPKWIPAKQKDQVVAAYREQPVTFTIQDVK